MVNLITKFVYDVFFSHLSLEKSKSCISDEYMYLLPEEHYQTIASLPGVTNMQFTNDLNSADNTHGHFKNETSEGIQYVNGAGDKTVNWISIQEYARKDNVIVLGNTDFKPELEPADKPYLILAYGDIAYRDLDNSPLKERFNIIAFATSPFEKFKKTVPIDRFIADSAGSFIDFEDKTLHAKTFAMSYPILMHHNGVYYFTTTFHIKAAPLFKKALIHFGLLRFNIDNANKMFVTAAESATKQIREAITSSKHDLENMLARLIAEQRILEGRQRELDSVMQSSTNVLNIIEQLGKIKTIENIYMDEEVFSFDTKPITYYDEDNDRWFCFGRFHIVLKGTQTSVYNKDYAVEGYAGAGSYHPHVMNDNVPCWGNAAQPISKAIATLDFYSYVMILMQYLRSVNKEDSAGKHYEKWMSIEEYKTAFPEFADEVLYDHA